MVGVRSSAWRRLFLALAAGGCACSCEAGESPADASPGTGVRIVAEVDARLFAEGGDVRVQVWDANQLASLEQNARCASVRNPATGGTEIRCPPGIAYQPVVPEQFDFPVKGIEGSVSLVSATLRAGDRFRILLAGKSRDGCNRTSSDHTGVADGAEVRLEGLAWTTTARACVTP